VKRGWAGIAVAGTALELFVVGREVLVELLTLVATWEGAVHV
jgi:hypothetical protein